MLNKSNNIYYTKQNYNKYFAFKKKYKKAKE